MALAVAADAVLALVVFKSNRRPDPFQVWVFSIGPTLMPLTVGLLLSRDV